MPNAWVAPAKICAVIRFGMPPAIQSRRRTESLWLSIFTGILAMKPAASLFALSFLVVAGYANFSWGEDKAPTKSLQIPEGTFLIEEDVWYQLANEPDRHFHSARARYLSEDHAGAADDIRKATAILKIATGQSPPELRKPLQASILELETLAAEARGGKLHSTIAMDRIFARAFVALAEHNYVMALMHVKAEEPEQAGHHLRASARDLQHAAAWRSEGYSDALIQTVIEAEKLGAGLVSGAGDLFGQAARVLDAMHSHIEKLRKLNAAAE
jgi:hypothetical protein